MNINTINTKAEQLEKGCFTVGAGPEVLLLMGSCRTVPYLNYFDYLQFNNRFTVKFIDPFNWHWDHGGNPVDYESKINSLETDSAVLGVIKSAKWFVHEHYENYGMFNTDKSGSKNIYQFGMAPEHDICIPNFRDKFILFQDIVTFDGEIRTAAAADYNATGRLSDNLQQLMKSKGLSAIEKFMGICKLTSLPEMGAVFSASWRQLRYFHTMNHISNNFTNAIFRLLNGRFLKLEAPDSFWERILAEDMYCTPHTPMTGYDVMNYGLEWQEPIAELKL